MTNLEIFKQVEEHPFEKGFLSSGEAVIDRRHKRIVDAVEGCGHICEFGPGNGKLGVYFISKGIPVSFVDISRERLRDFYTHIGDEVSVPCFVYSEPWELRFLPDDGFGAVIAAEVIEHVKDWKRLIVEMIRIARKKVVITTPVGESFWDPGHKHFFEKSDFDFLDNFTIEEIITKEGDKQTGNRCYLVEIDTR